MPTLVLVHGTPSRFAAATDHMQNPFGTAARCRKMPSQLMRHFRDAIAFVASATGTTLKAGVVLPGASIIRALYVCIGSGWGAEPTAYRALCRASRRGRAPATPSIRYRYTLFGLVFCSAEKEVDIINQFRAHRARKHLPLEVGAVDARQLAKKPHDPGSWKCTRGVNNHRLEEEGNWLQCNACKKWRLVSDSLFDLIQDDDDVDCERMSRGCFEPQDVTTETWNRRYQTVLRAKDPSLALSGQRSSLDSDFLRPQTLRCPQPGAPAPARAPRQKRAFDSRRRAHDATAQTGSQPDWDGPMGAFRRRSPSPNAGSGRTSDPLELPLCGFYAATGQLGGAELRAEKFDPPFWPGVDKAIYAEHILTRSKDSRDVRFAVEDGFYVKAESVPGLGD